MFEIKIQDNGAKPCAYSLSEKFLRKETAFDRAVSLAESKVRVLTENCEDPLVSYGIPEGTDEYQSGISVAVEQYTLRDEYDDTGETNRVVTYSVEEFI